jgi:shikimate kinase
VPDPFEKTLDNTLIETTFEDLEEDLLDASQEEYQYVISTGPI